MLLIPAMMLRNVRWHTWLQTITLAMMVTALLFEWGMHYAISKASLEDQHYMLLILVDGLFILVAIASLVLSAIGINAHLKDLTQNRDEGPCQ